MKDHPQQNRGEQVGSQQEKSCLPAAEHTHSCRAHEEGWAAVVAEEGQPPELFRRAGLPLRQLGQGPGAHGVSAHQPQNQSGKPCAAGSKERGEQPPQRTGAQLRQPGGNQQGGEDKKGEEGGDNQLRA